jgi:hypothetical protein
VKLLFVFDFTLLSKCTFYCVAVEVMYHYF